MSDELYLGLTLIKVLCLIIIATSLSSMASGSSYFAGTAGAASNRFLTESDQIGLQGLGSRGGTSSFVGGGANEVPVFWNIGSLSEVGAAQQAGVIVPESDEIVYQANLGGQGTSGFSGGYLPVPGCEMYGGKPAAPVGTSGFSSHPRMLNPY
jgi:hypothetical protein